MLLLLLLGVGAGLVSTLFPVTPALVHAQSADLIYLRLTASASGSTGISGFAFNSYGGYGVADDEGNAAGRGFRVGGVASSLSLLIWDSVAQEIRVWTPAPFAHPLTSVQVEYGSVYNCEGRGTFYTCTNRAAADAWAAGEEHNVALTFTAAPAPAITPTPSGTGFTIPDVDTRGLPGLYGSADPPKDITLHSSNNDPRGIWSDGTTIWVLDRSDNKLYAYTLATGNRDTDKEFNLSSVSLRDPTGLWGDEDNFWLIQSHTNGGRSESIAPYTYSIDNSGSITATAQNRITLRNTNIFGEWADDLYRDPSDGSFYVSRREEPGDRYRVTKYLADGTEDGETAGGSVLGDLYRSLFSHGGELLWGAETGGGNTNSNVKTITLGRFTSDTAYDIPDVGG